MWLRTPQKATDAWLCALGNWSNHSETWAAVPFCTKNCPNWHQTVLGGENWPTTCAQHVGTTWQAFPPNYFVAAFITTLRLCVRKHKAPMPIFLHKTGLTLASAQTANHQWKAQHLVACPPTCTQSPGELAVPVVACGGGVWGLRLELGQEPT